VLLAGMAHIMTTMTSQPTPTRGSGPIQCTDDRCHGHRARCNFGRLHTWSTWFSDGHLMRTADTYHCADCGGVCVGDEA
jgi:hypothetical protein